ncbi:uncharacterized protein LOC117115313 [Anneissia japonica]|uniref:uncharacterized protein LOC117115313 n=1 Tax=Anneissia japonica TaxID=1529436 RepID=UPI001425B0A2|nr:uncharacterized protein LOC117115313 [Anneissia japonica]
MQDFYHTSSNEVSLEVFCLSVFVDRILIKMTRTTELLKFYLKENTNLSSEKIDEIVPTGYERSQSSDIEIDGYDSIGSGPGVTKEDARKMRNIADEFNEQWKKPIQGIVSDYTDASEHGSSTSLKSMLNTYFQQNQLMSDDDKKTAFAFKILADITTCVVNSEYVKNAARDVCELVDGYSM